MENKVVSKRGMLNFKDVYVSLFYSINRNSLKFEEVYSPDVRLSEVVNHYLMDMRYLTIKSKKFPGTLLKKKIEELKLKLTRGTIKIIYNKYYDALRPELRDHYPDISLLDDLDEYTYDSIMSKIDVEIGYIGNYISLYLSKMESSAHSVNNKIIKNLFNFVKDSYNISFSSKESNDRVYRLLEKLNNFLSIYYYYDVIEQLTDEIRENEREDTVFKYYEDTNNMKREWNVTVNGGCNYNITSEEYSSIENHYINIYTSSRIYSIKTANMKFSKKYLKELSKDIFNDNEVRGYLYKFIKNLLIKQEDKSIKISFSFMTPISRIEKFTGLKYKEGIDGYRIHRALSDLIIVQLTHFLIRKIDKYEPDKINDKDNVKDKLVMLSEELQSLIEEIE